MAYNRGILFLGGGAASLTPGTTVISGGTDTRVLFNDGGTVGEDSGFTFDKTNNALTLGGATLTTSNPVLNLSQTWNSAGVTFTGLKLNVTNTASASASMLMDLQLGGTSRFKVTREGFSSFTDPGSVVGATVTINRGANTNSGLNLYTGDNAGDAFRLYSLGGGAPSEPNIYINAAGHYYMRTAMVLSGHTTAGAINTGGVTPGNLDVWSDINGPAISARSNDGTAGDRIFDGFSHDQKFVHTIENDGWISMGAGSTYASLDLKFGREAADILALRRGVNAQQINWYYTYTDASNRQYGALRTAAGYVELAALTAGTGADDIDVLLTAAGAGKVYTIAPFEVGPDGAGEGVVRLRRSTNTDVAALQYATTSSSRWSHGLRETSDDDLHIFNFAAGADAFVLKNNAIGFMGFGGLTSSFPALKRSGATLIVTGGDDSAVGGITANGPTAGIGYATGAGGTVTQATDRTTTVELNKVTGKVTTTNTSLAAITIVSFTVTNSTVAATDSIILSKVSGDIDTSAWVSAVAAGSFNVSLRNNDAIAADTTAFVFNFAVIKGVIA